MLNTLRNSWQFAKLSYGIVWDHKKLMVLPVLSTLAAILVTAAFVLPLLGGGTLDEWLAKADGNAAAKDKVGLALLAFAFYFCNYFVIVFFNSALVGCTMQVLRGEEPSIGAGLSAAAARLPQIFAWALVSASVGMILRAIENANEKVGQWISAIIGSAWTALTYFVVPFIVMEGVAPWVGIKKSVNVLKRTWGTALVSNFSIGLLGFLIMLPIVLVAGFLVVSASNSGSTASLVLAIAVAVVLVGFGAALTSAADVVLKALLFNYATGRDTPTDVDTSGFNDAFRSTGR